MAYAPSAGISTVFRLFTLLLLIGTALSVYSSLPALYIGFVSYNLDHCTIFPSTTLYYSVAGFLSA